MDTIETDFREVDSYQNDYQFSSFFGNAKEFNCFKANCKLDARPDFKRSRPIERSEIGLLLAPASREGDGCDSVVVSIEACGKPFSREEKALGKKGLQLALGPGSNPGRGPQTFLGGG